jgi:site-specific DNA-methyltransferase (adenine-specific)
MENSFELFCADSLAVLKELPTGEFDALITDPPYSSGGFTRGDRTASTTSKYVSSDSGNRDRLDDFTGDNRDQRAFGYWSALWLSEAMRTLKPGGIAAIFTDWRQLPVSTDYFQAGGLIWRGIVPWVKPAVRPTSGRFNAQCEYVVWGSAGPMPIDYAVPPLPGFYHYPSPRDRDHITQKPVDLMMDILKIVKPGGKILDPFMGSGTTGVAALSMGFDFVGIEMSPTHYETAQRRIGAVAGTYKPEAGQDVLEL